MADLVSGDRRIGRAVGWRLAFPDLGLSFGHDTHYARIEAALESGLVPSHARVRIEAMNALDFGRLATAHRPSAPRQPRPLVKAVLTLFWRDRVGDQPSADAAPPTLVLGLSALSRSTEGVRIVTTLEFRDWVFQHLERGRIRSGICPVGPMAALSVATTDAGLGTDEAVLHPPQDSEPTGGPDLPEDMPVLEVLTQVGASLSASSQRGGRSPFLIRDGVLHAGTERPIPFAPTPGASGEPYPLTESEGLIRAWCSGTQRATVPGTEPPERDQVSLTLVGQPSLKPGDVVTVTLESADAGQFGGFGLPVLAPSLTGPAPGATQVCIDSVQHQLGRNEGWTTNASGVVVELPDGTWDVLEAAPGAAAVATVASADAATNIARRVHEIAQEEVRRMRPPRVGEVRAVHAATSGSGATTSAAQSVDVLVGLEPGDGRPRRARRQPIARHDRAWRNVPYLSPFAWGPYGLVLPQYPGSRVLMAFHEGQENDPVVLGALWRTDGASTSAAPQNAEAGDWWLILPAGLPSERRAGADGTAEVALPDPAKASHDLIDGSGARVIQIRELTIRALPDSDLGTPQTRPAAGAEGGVLIEHHNGARIHIDREGAITIEASKGLKLKAAEDVVIEGRNIQLKGSTVDVQS